ncbi:FAD-binding domain-containing protein [Amniculicola lignicola CBS 123094]|uniref:Delta(24)-sterol reductase n=1 Tax=Amniculicola lignicola CBS 123094 TaxID=1392246 RepID=A0A6A5W2H9_9PLEO|nr:FAD-binding domain-containing protein [Amniculicola lignicola CBS 123094]
MPTHEEAVSQTSTTVKSLFDRNEPFRIFHGSTNSTRPGHFDKTVDISALSHVLHVDPDSKTATVEPNVSMDKLVQATLACGMIPPVVMEFPGITVGGGYAGSAGESSSFKYGYFDETVRKVEMILATGEVVTASSSENSDLFKGAAGAMGTLGITTKLEISLIRARRFVKLEYQSYSSIRETIAAVRAATEDRTNDYVDGIVYSETHGVLMTGHLTDELPANNPPQSFSFWVGKAAFKYFRVIPFTRLSRWFLDDFLHTRTMYRALRGSNMSFAHMIQDLSLPYDTAEDFITYTSKELAIWPLWLCPLRAVKSPTFHPSSVDSTPERHPQPMLNIGLWGPAAKDMNIFIQENRSLEARLTQLGGRKVLYSHTYYTEEEFWRLYDRKWYQELREKYVATSLPTVFEKVRVDVSRERLLQG